LPTNNDAPPSWWASGPFGQGLLALVLLGATMGVLFMAIWFNDKLVGNVSILFVGGLIVLMMALGGLAALLASISLSETRDAFALPPGTIRALLAVGLLVVFVVFGIGELNRLNEASSVGKEIETTTAPANDDGTAAAIAKYERMGIIAIPQPRPAVSPAPDVVELRLYRRTDPAAANDLAKQLMTMISTLLTTVVGFYFGSRSASETAAAATAAAAPGAGVNVLADVEVARRELEALATKAEPTLALIAEIRAKTLTDEQKAKATPLLAEADKRIADLKAGQQTVEQKLQAVRAAIDAAGAAKDAAASAAEQQKAATALNEARTELKRLETLAAAVSDVLKALQDATAEG
jgi:hypothetical protein